ncbi:RNA polymerase sigma factor [Butyrivibrio sp. NC2002]|uniref:RNA polymerase sigma factor n=1 Tax=Butyrivibrio sp. NC2002 TaxID=1410610 RepID=UPI000B30F458|nr:RNA polymerase sigma factor [Butyrivibrio sp. NC2002]
MLALTVRQTFSILLCEDLIVMKEKITHNLISLFAQVRMSEKSDGAATKESSCSKEIAGRLLDSYGDTILRVAYSYLHNMSDAEDILQETLIRVFTTKPHFLSSSHEKAWLIKVASNLSKNRISYNKLRETDELNEELVAGGREDLSFVWEAVKKLPEKYREVIHLYYEEGYSTKDIADILGRNESTVRSDLKRGRDSLKAVLKEAYDFE